MKNHKIGISGKIASGKDTMADLLGFNNRIALADSLREFSNILYSREDIYLRSILTKYLYEYFGTNDKLIKEILDNKNRFEYRINDKNRDILQFYGMLLRKYDEKIWLKLASKKIKEDEDTVITDIRLENEVLFFRELGFTIVRVISDVVDRQNRYYEKFGRYITDKQLNDISETSLDLYNDWDIIIYNKDIESLKKEIENIFGNKEMING